MWDNSLEPALEVDPGDTVELECADASGGQLTAHSTERDVLGLDMARVNPVTGPVYVKGAEPGDVLAVEILELAPRQGWGWTALIPGFGLLAEEFPDPWLRISEVDPDREVVRFSDRVSLPYMPFPGTIGLAPDEPGPHSVVPPTKWGGNMDIKHLRPGTTLMLPVGVQGALFSVGDTHAAMGDGEVCGTAIETAMRITVRLSVRRDRPLRFPQYSVPSGHPAEAQRTGYHVCTGIGPDLLEATRDATRQAIDYLVDHHGCDPQEAYAITSVAVDLRIHEVVDIPNWTVGAFLPDAIFTSEEART